MMSNGGDSPGWERWPEEPRARLITELKQSVASKRSTQNELSDFSKLRIDLVGTGAAAICIGIGSDAVSGQPRILDLVAT
jgi:hypothetical protein